MAYFSPNNAGVLKLLINAGVKNGKPLFSVCLSLTITLYLSPKARSVGLRPHKMGQHMCPEKREPPPPPP